MSEDKRQRRSFSSEEKAQAVRRHVLGGESVLAVCEALGIAPNQFYRWQKDLFDHAAAASGRATSAARSESPDCPSGSP